MSRPSVPCEIRIAEDAAVVVAAAPAPVKGISWRPCAEPAARFFYHPGSGNLIGLCGRHLDSPLGDGWTEVLDEDEVHAVLVHSS